MSAARRSGFRSRVLVTLCAASLAVVLLVIGLTSEPLSHIDRALADPAGTVGEVAIDMDPTGNTPTSLGPREVCVSKNVGDTFDIDVTVKGIDPADAIAGFQYTLHYNNNMLRVAGVDNQQLLAAGGGIVPIDSSDELPDVDGAFTAALADFGPSDESGDGVLSRITLESVGNGVSGLELDGVILGVVDDEIPRALNIARVLSAFEAQGENCPDTPPSPTPSPTPSPPPETLAPAIPMDAMSVDVDIAGNDATTLGPLDECLATQASIVQVDVTATNIPVLNPLVAAFEYSLSYSPSAISIAAADHDFLAASGPGSDLLVGLGDELPNSDGRYRASIIDTKRIGESGDGVLSRLTIDLSRASPGVYELDLTRGVHLDNGGFPHGAERLNDARIAVGGASCSEASSPTPTPTQPPSGPDSDSADQPTVTPAGLPIGGGASSSDDAGALIVVSAIAVATAGLIVAMRGARPRS